MKLSHIFSALLVSAVLTAPLAAAEAALENKSVRDVDVKRIRAIVAKQ